MMDPQEIMVRVAASVMNEDAAEMENLVDEMEALIKALPEGQAETADALRLQLAGLRAMMDSQKALNMNEAEFMAEIKAAEESGDEARLQEIADRMMQGSEAAMAHLEEFYPPAAPLSAEVQTLFDAIEDGDLSATRAALQVVDVNGRFGEFEKTPLYQALSSIEKRAPEMVKLLLEAGADARIGMTDGYTPLHAIADHIGAREDVAELSDVVRLLVDAGADIEARTESYGWTPLQRAVMEGDPVEMEALLRNGADPGAIYAPHSMPCFSPGRTQLQIAGSNTDKVRLLLEFGANPKQMDAHGETCADYLRAEFSKAPGLFTQLVGDRGYRDGIQASLDLIEMQPGPQ